MTEIHPPIASDTRTITQRSYSPWRSVLITYLVPSDLITSSPGRMQSIVTSMSVCLSVCTYMYISKTTRPNITRFLGMLTVWLSIWLGPPLAICCVLPVLWMTSHIHEVGSMVHSQRINSLNCCIEVGEDRRACPARGKLNVDVAGHADIRARKLARMSVSISVSVSVSVPWNSSLKEYSNINLSGVYVTTTVPCECVYVVEGYL